MRRLPAWPKPGTIASVRGQLKNQFKSGARVFVIGDHPWSGHAGTLIAFEPYGPAVFGWSGWRVKLDCNCGECYARPSDLQEARKP